MKKLFLILLLTCTNTSCLIAQPSIQWQKSLGGTGLDMAYSVRQTIDGGYIVAGLSDSSSGDVTGNHGLYDYWIVKLDSTGIMQWQHSLGGTGSEEAWSIQQTTDNGYIVAGFSSSNDNDVTGNHGLNDFWIVKLNSMGTIQWQKCLGGTGNDYAESVQQTTDGGYIIAGISFSNDSDVTGNHGLNDYWIVKLDSTGTMQWQHSLGGTGSDEACSIQQIIDGGYIVAGFSNSNDGDVTGNHGDDSWIVKLNNAGIIQWQKSLGGTGYDIARSIRQTTDSGYIFTGSSDSNDGDVTGNHGDFDYWVVKLNGAGVIQWQKSLGGTTTEYAISIEQTTEGGYIIAGVSHSNDSDVTGNHGHADIWIVKLTGTGNIQWQKCLGGTEDDGTLSIQQATDGGYVVAGWSYSNDGDVTGNHGSWDYWVVKLNPVILGTEEINSPVSDLQIIPNPVSESIVISFSLFQAENILVNVYDITGRLIKEVFKGNLNPGNHQIKWNVADDRGIDDGVYILNFTANSFSQTLKLVVVEQSK